MSTADPADPVIQCEARGFRFDVSGDAEVAETLRDLFAALVRPTGRADATFSVRRKSGEESPWHLRMDGRLMMGCEQLGEALHGLVVHINQRVVHARDDVLSIHAAAVATTPGAALLPGASGHGKTTLCARLLQCGAAYLSDDSVALDSQGILLGYPKPLGFKAGTWEQFAGLADLDFGPQIVWQVPPSRLGARSITSAEPVVVVVPRFERGSPVRIESLPRHTIAAAILEQAQNLLTYGVEKALEVVGRLAATVPGWTVVYGDARIAAPAVLELIASTDGKGVPFEVLTGPPAQGAATQPFAASDVHTLLFEDGVLLVRGGSGRFAALDGTGARLWPLLDGQRSVQSIGAELAPVFGVPRAVIESDVSRWIGELVSAGFLVLP